MKKLLLLSAILFSAGSALADANDISFMQRNPTNTGYITRIPLTPTDGSSVIFMFNGTNNQPAGTIPQAGYAIIGSGLSYDGVTLSATAGAGSVGPAGPTGATGAQGPKGDTGAQGVQGSSGATGPAGSAGAVGSAGPTGVTGATGLTGATGPAGAAGSQGAAGATGSQGPIGLTGAKGDNGAQGIPGIAGSTGATGSTGSQGPVGLTGPTGATGAAGTSAAQFNFSAPAARTIALSTAYQAADNTKAAITTISPSCQNATTVLASSACTLQVRQSSTAGLTCNTGTVSMTWTSTVQLGLVFTQSSGSPFDVKLPIGGYMILCPSAGTFTIAAVEQTAG